MVLAVLFFTIWASMLSVQGEPIVVVVVVGYMLLGIYEWKFLHPCNVHVGGMVLEVENFKNHDSKMVFHPNSILRIRHF